MGRPSAANLPKAGHSVAVYIQSLIGHGDVSQVETSRHHPGKRLEISLSHIAPECHSGNSASFFSISAALFLCHPAGQRVPRAFCWTAFASGLKPG